MAPLISVGMPVFNGERYLADAIDSILGQTCSNFELIISDNASRDGTQAICGDYARRDCRVRYFRQRRNIGASRNYNFVFQRSLGNYFKWAAAGDLCEPLLLELCIRGLDAHPSAVLCCGQTMYFGKMVGGDLAGASLLGLGSGRPSDRFIHFVDNVCINNAYGGVFRSNVLRRTRLEAPYPGSDLVLLAELALYGPFLLIREVLHHRRMSPETATSCRTMDAIWDMYRPGHKRRFFLPTCRRFVGYFASVVRSRIPLDEKARAIRDLTKRLYWSKRRLWREVVDNGRRLL
jgi:glycosyltransferase involved in cell wall biosynthesis